MKNNSKVKENLSWFLIAISPISFGSLIVATIIILIAKHYGLDLSEDGIIVVPIYFLYTFIWAKIYRKVTGVSWLD
jgi:hypothetical protein